MRSLKPKKAQVLKGNAAWWRDERGCIVVYIQSAVPPLILSCTIKRSTLVKYIERTKR